MTTRTSLTTLVLASLLPATAMAQQPDTGSTVRVVAGNIVEVDVLFAAPDTCHRIVQADAGAPEGVTPPEDAIPATVTISRETGGDEEMPAEMAPSDLEPAPELPDEESTGEAVEGEDTEIAPANGVPAGEGEATGEAPQGEPAPDAAQDEAVPAAPGAVPMDEQDATLPDTADPSEAAGGEATQGEMQTDMPVEGQTEMDADPFANNGEAPIVRQACETGLFPLQSSFALSLESGKNAVQIYFLDRSGEVIDTERVEFSE